MGHEDLTGTAWPAAAGDPVAYYIPGLDLQQVTYRTGQGELYELSWRGPDPVTGRNLMEGSGAPVAVSDPAAFYSPATNTKHVIYRGPFGHLFELWFVPGGQPAVVDLTLEARASRAIGRPAAFYGGNVAGSQCPTGGAHTAPSQSGSADYHLPYSGPFV